MDKKKVLIYRNFWNTGSLEDLQVNPEPIFSLYTVFEIKRNWWSPKAKAGGPGVLPRKNFKFKVAKPLKFNSQNLSYSTENCRRLFPVKMIFTSLMTLKVKNKTWISNFQVHMQAETNLHFKFM